MNRLDRYIEWFKNNKISAIVLFAMVVFFGFNTIVSAYKNLRRNFTDVDYSSSLDITIKSFDPRFNVDGNPMNWGGGSQSLFIGCDLTDSLLRKSPSIADKCDIWESINFGYLEFEVNAIYNGESGSPTCLVNEWGIEILPAEETPKSGFFYSYKVGGADALRQGATCSVKKPEGSFPLTVWFEKDQKIKRPERYQYLKPGEIIGLKTTISFGDNYTGNREANGPESTDAVNLKVYALVRIDGENKKVYSKNSMRILIPEKSDSLHWKDDLDYQLIEDLRKETIIE